MCLGPRNQSCTKKSIKRKLMPLGWLYVHVYLHVCIYSMYRLSSPYLKCLGLDYWLLEYFHRLHCLSIPDLEIEMFQILNFLSIKMALQEFQISEHFEFQTLGLRMLILYFVSPQGFGVLLCFKDSWNN